MTGALADVAGAAIEIVIARADRIDTATLAQLRAELPTWRQERADGYYHERDRAASITVFALLQRLWAETRGPSPLPAIERGRYGKPGFVGVRGVEFNVSHDASICVAAMAAAPIGIDVQTRVPFDDGLFTRMAAPGELALRAHFADRDDLSWLWSRKEAVMKRSGVGLQAALDTLDTFAEPGLVSFTVDGVDAVVSVGHGRGIASDLLARCRVRLLEPALNTVDRGATGRAHRVRWRERTLVPTLSDCVPVFG